MDKNAQKLKNGQKWTKWTKTENGTNIENWKKKLKTGLILKFKSPKIKWQNRFRITFLLFVVTMSHY